MNLNCPGCGTELVCNESLLGQDVKCPQCSQVFRAEAPSPPAATPSPIDSPPPPAPTDSLAPPPRPQSSAPPETPPPKGKYSLAALLLGIASTALGLFAFVVQLLGGLCCGWIGWPVALAGIICGVLAIVLGTEKVHKILGIAGIIASVIGFILQIAVTLGLLHFMKSQSPDMFRL